MDGSVVQNERIRKCLFHSHSDFTGNCRTNQIKFSIGQHLQPVEFLMRHIEQQITSQLIRIRMRIEIDFLSYSIIASMFGPNCLKWPRNVISILLNGMQTMCHRTAVDMLFIQILSSKLNVSLCETIQKSKGIRHCN